MKLAEIIQLILETEGKEVYHSDVFINMLDDFGAFTEMPYAKSIFKQMWIKDYHNQIVLELINESNLRHTVRRIIDNLNANNGFDRNSLITVCNELLKGLDSNLTIESNGGRSVDLHGDFPIESHVFIPSEDGIYVRYYGIPQNVSFNDIAKILDHDTNQYFLYSPPYSTGIRDIYIAFESFSGNILYVYVNEKTLNLSASKVRKALQEYSFTAEYDYSKYCDDIEEGIKRGNLRKDFFKHLLNQDSDIMIDSRFNTKLIFTNDKLVKMESMNLLSADAMSFRDTSPKRKH